MSKWIDFHKLNRPSGRKTDVYQVLTKDGRSLLGIITWYASWRCYSFQPNSNCIFEKQCLQDITDFLVNLMNERKKDIRESIVDSKKEKK